MQRNFNRPEDVGNQNNVNNLLNTPSTNFFYFEIVLRVILHDSFHCVVSGTMCDISSANDPVFWLHHCFIDKLWDDWQGRGAAFKNAHFPSVTPAMPAADSLARNFIDNTNLPGNVRVCYQASTSGTSQDGTTVIEADRFQMPSGMLDENSKSYSKVSKYGRKPALIPSLNERALDLFNVDAKEREVAHESLKLCNEAILKRRVSDDIRRRMNLLNEELKDRDKGLKKRLLKKKSFFGRLVNKAKYIINQILADENM